MVTSSVDVESGYKQALELFYDGKHLDATDLYKNMKSAVENGTAVDSAGNAVTADSAKWTEVLSSEELTWLAQMRQFADEFEAIKADLPNWKSAEAQDKDLPETMQPKVYFRSNDDGTLHVVTTAVIDWKLHQAAAFFLESDMGKKFYQTSTKQTVTIAASPVKNVVVTTKQIKYPWPMKDRWGSNRGVAFMGASRNSITQAFHSCDFTKDTFLGSAVPKQPEKTELNESLVGVIHFEKISDTQVQYYNAQLVAKKGGIVPKGMVEKILKDHASKAIVDVCKNFNKIKFEYLERIQSKPHVYNEVKGWYE